MIKLFFLTCIIQVLAISTIAGQEVTNEAEQQLEALTEAEESETEDDYFLQQIAHYKKSPLDLNNAEAEELQEFRILTDLQIQNLLSYRRLLGKLISVYELQAVPAWDIVTIKKILPFIMVGNAEPLSSQLINRFRGGNHTLLIRSSQVLEEAIGFDTSAGASSYQGSPLRLFTRYRYAYKNLLQYGVVADKDAGEQLFRGNQRLGFDFYSFHFFARKYGIVKAVALGDYTVSMGQGLIQWQAMAFKKNAGVTGIKRQSAIIKPYNSAGEYNFHRGAAITVGKGNWEASSFVSLKKVSANIAYDAVTNKLFFTSIQASGLHRTVAEEADKNKLNQTSLGANVTFHKNKLRIGLNSVYYHFSLPMQKDRDPYNLFAIRGNTWYNISADYSYTFKNMHVFGEVAFDKAMNKATVNGLLVSVSPTIDMSVLQRSISPAYQAINANAFTENTMPGNENGIYAGVAVRPFAYLQVQAYTDVYRFPWLKYLVDAPSSGRDYFIQCTYTPDKKIELYTRYKVEAKQKNNSAADATTNQLAVFVRKNWRLHLNYAMTKELTFRSRIDMLWNSDGKEQTTGFLMFADLLYKPMLKPFSATVRVQYFETDDYNSRIYAYENDVLYSYSVPGFSDSGYRYYLLLNINWFKKLRTALRWSQTIYTKASSIGSGLDQISGNKKSEIKIQLMKEF